MSGRDPGRSCSGQTLADLGEDRLVAAVLSRYGEPPAWLRVPAGDDAAVVDLAVLDLDLSGLVAATDTVVQDLDFRMEWSSGADVGVKVAAQNLADVAAMGARPLGLLVSLAAPDDLPAQWALDLADGLAVECARAGAHVIGGDVSSARQVVITGTAFGVLTGGAVRRGGARPADVVALAGEVGPSAAGLAWLERHGARLPGAEPGAAEPGAAEPGAAEPSSGVAEAVARVLAAHRRPQPPYYCGELARESGATAMIDISDGLLRDAQRVGRAGRVVLDLSRSALGIGDDVRRVADELGADPWDWVLTGGEDHALLACFPPGVAPPPPFRVVGVVRGEPAGLRGEPARPGSAVLDSAAPVSPGVVVDGVPWGGSSGWRHFG